MDISNSINALQHFDQWLFVEKLYDTYRCDPEMFAEVIEQSSINKYIKLMDKLQSDDKLNEVTRINRINSARRFFFNSWARKLKLKRKSRIVDTHWNEVINDYDGEL